ncbi:RsmB/NOP family class I SAM-dependent RNA methyltransferase [Limoniibacter endophyticus]|uniref:MFS transporter n=1 Tax=Limoniibacter endophyticus TaxID=1565040 RepID=A0A8J3DI62_9HYPH|nr:RsmB/NOP family class I SAM-dependent RNA methyltransferase [Limoniibacter endophyticus]GHC73870.1 MFS transporter [Limoniibacter endophyticus]
MNTPASAPRKTSKIRQKADTPDIPGLAVRQTAAKLLAAIVEQKTSLDGLTDEQHGQPHYRALDSRDRGLVRAILLTALRYRRTIEALIERRLERPLPGNATTLSHILHVGAAQILFLDLPDHAAVDLAVEHAKHDPRTRRFANLVNAILRTLIRIKERALPAALAQTVDAPDWFVERMRQTYGEEKTKAILAAHRVEAPLDFTVKENAAEWAKTLGGITTPTGSVRVSKPEGAISTLPGYEEGAWWIQDAAAALPVRLFKNISGKSVADLCAAPGGKTAQLAVRGAEVTAVEQSANRLRRLQENFARLRLDASFVHSNLLDLPDEAGFDAVLLDAPCSSTGTVRRHPDVLWAKDVSDIEKLADLQYKLLQKAVSLVPVGGTIVFSNCSLDRLEGEALIDRFIATEKNVKIDAIEPDEIEGIAPLLTERGELRSTPADFDLGFPQLSGLDGFYAVRLNRTR